MVRTRPCRICRRWFRPHPRAGDRQRVCSDVECQRERHRRSCRTWRDRERAPARREQLETRIRQEPADRSGVGPISGRLRWDGVRDAVGPEALEIVEILIGVVEDGVRDAVAAEVSAIIGEPNRVVGSGPRDAIAARARDG